MIRLCGYCNHPTYDQDPIPLEIEGKQLRLWVCSSECAYMLGQTTTLGLTTLRGFRAHFTPEQLSEL